jgi:hypothetical protein
MTVFTPSIEGPRDKDLHGVGRPNGEENAVDAVIVASVSTQLLE